MRIRALLFIPALAAAVLAIGVSSASAATLFNTNNHAATNRVTIGATTTATSEGPIVLTRPTGTVSNTCTHGSLTVRVVENTTARSSLDVYSSHLSGCEPLGATGTHVPAWRLTVTGEGVMVGGSTAYNGTVHSVAFDLFPNVPGVFAGNLENGITVTQNTTTTNGLCVDVNDSGTVVNATLALTGFIDAKFCLTSAPGSAWSLT